MTTSCMVSAKQNNPKTYHFPIKLFIALMLVTFVPAIYQTFRVFFVVSTGSVDGLDIIGQIEWFDLIDETLLAFLLVPLYYILNKFIENKKTFAARITQTCIIAFVIYLIFSVIVYISSLDIVSFMASAAPAVAEITTYLQLETIAFAVGFLGSFFAIVYVLIGKSRYIYAILIMKTILTVICDYFLIPLLGVNGVAVTNLIINSIVAVISVLLLKYEGLLHFKFDRITDFTWIKEWARVGFFSGVTILLNNIIYALIVCKMINDVAEVGNYWVANNFIWGWLLIPITALASIIMKECSEGCTKEKMKAYLAVNLFVLAAWILTIPFWNPIFTNLMGIPDPSGIIYILALLVPFYLAYNFSSLFDSIFTGMGKTHFTLIISVLVNIGYYGIMYLLFLNGIFSETIEFVIMLFGFGMVIHLAAAFFLYVYTGKKHGTVWIGKHTKSLM